MKVVHCKKEPYDIYIGRTFGSLKDIGWGNPFVIGIDGSRESVISKYENYIKRVPELLKRIPELRGKVLACWCKLTQDIPCHGDILVKLSLLSDEELNKLISDSDLFNAGKCNKSMRIIVS